MSLDRTEALITAVENNIGEEAGPISSFLAQYLAVILYAEMEERVAEVVKAHLEGHTHKAVAGFITTSLSDLIKRLPKSDIAKLTGRFGVEFRERFNQAMDDKSITLYMNVIEARHEIGHKRGSNITLGDVRKGHAAANEILTAFTKCLAEHQFNLRHARVHWFHGARLLTKLSENARLSNAELARQVGLLAPSVAERVRRLEDRGVMTGYGARVDPSNLGLALTIMIRARPLPGEMKNMIKALRDTPEIVRCDRVSGDDCFVPIAHVRDVKQMEAVIDRIVPYGATNSAIVPSAPFEPRLPVIRQRSHSQ